ncbi:F-box domain-containing protein [Caenorhabditis elegans]|uniref:F-box domain-containing protein n=1 Tax=Caenorhabditis elegans TaxID=6239 RepID=Q22212_CAEEL|nr:F-box domain-containing protein [Caenorhabditis elegans]CCD65784.1 F-box domain-containing protein [Caenorhabditis elegans]|eukprot:NP_505001.1 Uncharacterized protein CELE_T05B11.1 [Caenorhabditis elegans]
MDLSSMPDDVLIRLLNTASPNDVARAKRLNKRFHQIVDTFNLGKPRVKEFCVESRVSPISPSKIGRLRLGSTSNAPKRRVVVTMRRDRGVKRSERIEDPSRSTSSESANSFVQENLRKVELQEKLSFDGVTLDEEFYKMLTAKKEALRHVTTLALSLCHIRLSWTQFMDLLSRMTIKHLYIDFCTFHPSLISDKVLMSLTHLETIQIQPRYPCFLNEVTDQTLIHWATRTTAPNTIQFRNGCASRITVDGIRHLMTRALSTASTPNKMDLDFGLLLEPSQSETSLLTFILCPGLDFKVTDDFRSRKISLSRGKFCLQFFIPAPFPIGPHSVAISP